MQNISFIYLKQSVARIYIMVAYNLKRLLSSNFSGSYKSYSARGLVRSLRGAPLVYRIVFYAKMGREDRPKGHVHYEKSLSIDLIDHSMKCWSAVWSVIIDHFLQNTPFSIFAKFKKEDICKWSYEDFFA
jgi:hypothetical protein